MLIVDSLAFSIAFPSQFFGNQFFINNVLTDPSIYDYVSISINNPIFGCTDPLALNYNPLAECDDGSCICDLTTSLHKYPTY